MNDHRMSNYVVEITWLLTWEKVHCSLYFGEVKLSFLYFFFFWIKMVHFAFSQFTKVGRDAIPFFLYVFEP
ncbi:hypothetical protein ACFX13_001704 [Malus domestica]